MISVSTAAMKMLTKETTVCLKIFFAAKNGRSFFKISISLSRVEGRYGRFVYGGMEIPSSCGMLVYRLVTMVMVTSISTTD